MAGFVIFRKLSFAEAVETMRDMERWFQEHPKRRVCRTDLFRVRRGHVAEDVLQHTEVTLGR